MRVGVVAALVLLAIGGGSAPARAGAPAAAKPAFDGGRAYEHIRQLTSIGPRPAGSPASAQARRYLADQLKALGLTPSEQTFQVATPIGPLTMTNVLASLPGASKDRIVLAGHYDTKLFRQFPFVGANDGGSSAAMPIEFARALKGRAHPFTIELVFFDGEEATLPNWSGDDNTYGSRHYLQDAQQSGSIKQLRALVLVDMVGDRELDIRREQYSTKWLVDAIWSSAKKLGYAQHFLDEIGPIEDDHVAFVRAGVPAVDIIDLNYAAWHTPEDTIDKVSARSLQVVGDVVLDALPAIEAHLRK